jgi:hypothetical protein
MLVVRIGITSALSRERKNKARLGFVMSNPSPDCSCHSHGAYEGYVMHTLLLLKGIGIKTFNYRL